MSGYWTLVQVIGAVLVALISVFFSGILLESYKRHRDRQGVASALAGEIFSIIHMAQRREHAKHFAFILATLESGEKVSWPDITGGDPSQDDPVVKSQMDRLGFLPDNIPERIVTFYTYMRGIRIDIANLSKGAFREPRIEAEIIRADLIVWDDAVRLGNDLWRDLRNIATQPWWLQSFLVRRKKEIHQTSVNLFGKLRYYVKRTLGVQRQHDSAANTNPPQPTSGNVADNIGDALPLEPNTAELFASPFKELAVDMSTYLDATLLPTAGATFDGNRERALRHLLIDTQAAVFLERASRFIFGSQIDAVIYLGANNARATREEITRFYSAARQADPERYARYPFDAWLGFLHRNGLVFIDGDAVILSPGGKALINYMQARGYLTPRPGG
jgi:predicted DNA-binding ribbon-helix-helix protein